MCWAKACRNASIQFAGIDDWLVYLFYAKNSEIGKASGARLAELAEATDENTLETLIQLDFAHEASLAKKRARKETEGG